MTSVVQTRVFPLCGFTRVVLAFASLALLALLPASPLLAKPTPQAAEEEDYLTGKLLVALPRMSDPRFIHTVIFMVQHDSEGAMGIVINRPMGRGPLGKFLKGLGIEDKNASGKIQLHYGGPVQVNLGFVLHSTDYADDSTIKVSRDVAFTVGTDILKAMGAGSGPQQKLFALGYAGWGPGQLENELRSDSWVVVPGDAHFIFDGDPDKKWKRALNRQSLDL